MTVRGVEKLARAGLLPFYGRGEGRRTFVESCDAFLARVAAGEVVWPPRGEGQGKDAAREKGRSTATGTASGGRRSRLQAESPGVVRLVSRPPKRSGQSS